MACMDNGASSVERALIDRAKEQKVPINGSLELLHFLSLIELEVIPMDQIQQIVEHFRNQERIVQLSLVRGKGGIHQLVRQVRNNLIIFHDYIDSGVI